MKDIELLLHHIVDIAILLFEFIGVMVIIVTGIKGIYDYMKRNPQIRLNLAKGMALGLEFKLGSEILRTVIVREASEIITVAAIIALRAALTFLIHWEIKVEESGEELEAKVHEHEEHETHEHEAHGHEAH